jgi:hypothetical protein
MVVECESESTVEEAGQGHSEGWSGMMSAAV